MNTKPDENKVVRSLEVLQTPFCGELRSKKFYLRDQLASSAEDYIDGSGHIFCYLTQMPIGPDGCAAHPDNCGPDRVCYRSALEKPAPYRPGMTPSDYY